MNPSNIEIFSPLLSGFVLGIGLVCGIGPQNLLVIRKGLLSPALGMTAALTSATADLVVISLGALLLAPLVTGPIADMLLPAAAVYLLFTAFHILLDEDTELQRSDRDLRVLTRSTAKAALFYSVCNPWAWLDAVVVIGGSALTFPDETRAFFILGAASASLVWFSFVSVSVSKLGTSFVTPKVLRMVRYASAGVLLIFAFRLMKLL